MRPFLSFRIALGRDCNVKCPKQSSFRWQSFSFHPSIIQLTFYDFMIQSLFTFLNDVSWFFLASVLVPSFCLVHVERSDTISILATYCLRSSIFPITNSRDTELLFWAYQIKLLPLVAFLNLVRKTQSLD